MANGRTASHWSLGREANLWLGTSWPYVLWLTRMWQQRQGRPAQQRNVRLSSKSPNIPVWRIRQCIFQPIAVELLGPLNETACQFLKDLGRRISAQSGDERERERMPSCSKDYQLSFNNSMLSCSMTVLTWQTTWANNHSSIYILLTNFLFPHPRYRRYLGH